MGQAEEVFSDIYAADHWHGGSGAGPTEDASGPYCKVLQRLLASAEARNVVEAGCGDWQVGSLLDWTGVDYTGLMWCQPPLKRM